VMHLSRAGEWEAFWTRSRTTGVPGVEGGHCFLSVSKRADNSLTSNDTLAEKLLEAFRKRPGRMIMGRNRPGAKIPFSGLCDQLLLGGGGTGSIQARKGAKGE